MPTPNYNTGLIYKLVHKEDYDNVNIYIGSTTNFRGRKTNHKTRCNNDNDKSYNEMKYQIIRETGFNNWDMIQIEPFPCYSKKELETRERYWIDLYKPNLNKMIPTRSQKEYREDNVEKIKEINKIYYENNKEILGEKNKKYRENNIEKAKERDKKYCENNVEKIKERQKKYRENNVAQIKEKNKEQITCECGCILRKSNILK